MKLIDFWKDKDASSKKYSFIEYAYDSYFDNFLKTIKGMSSSEATRFVIDETEKGHIEKASKYAHVLLRHGEFYINIASPYYGEKFVREHEIANSLNLTTFPFLIEWFITAGGDMIIVTRIPGNTGQNINDRLSYSIANMRNEVSDLAKQNVIRELKMLESHGYLVDPKFRYCVRMNDDGRIIIPHFPLIPVEEVKSRTSDRFLKEIYGRYSMFGNYLGSAELLSVHRQSVADVIPHSDEID